jgi:hypothetical protein
MLFGAFVLHLLTVAVEADDGTTVAAVPHIRDLVPFAAVGDDGGRIGGDPNFDFSVAVNENHILGDAKGPKVLHESLEALQTDAQHKHGVAERDVFDVLKGHFDAVEVDGGAVGA